MLVPRAFKYSSSPPKEVLNEKGGSQNTRRNASPKTSKPPGLRPASPARITSEPALTPSPPITVPVPENTHSADARSMSSTKTRAQSVNRRKPSTHDPGGLPPAVAALLAVTEIPRPKANQCRRRPKSTRNISIDELVNEWKGDESLNASYSSSPALSVLFEDADDGEEKGAAQRDVVTEEDLLHTRSTSVESVPSLDPDARSLTSNGSLSTPESLRSRKSYTNIKRATPRSVPTKEECMSDHPLVERPPEDEDPDDGLILSPAITSRTPTPKPKSRLTSNLTTSLQALKNAVSSFTLRGATTPTQRTPSPPMSDEMLWSHPFLFPRFSSEIRPAIEGTPTKAQRRYLNPMPLSFEEQEAPYQQALHAPFLAEQIEGAPTIRMQTYSRGRRKSATRRSSSGPDPQSEAGRALLGAPGVRQREPRENSDFLRVVVMEMNMRREGKLEMGKAKIWLPPRQVSWGSEEAEKVPKRWVGESAY